MSRHFWLGVTAAGLCIAQAARIHPVIWVPSALVPLVVLIGPGRRRTRLLLTLAAGVGVLIVVALTSGPVLWNVIHGHLAQAWGSRAEHHARSSLLPMIAVALSIAVLAVRPPRAARYLIALGIVFLVRRVEVATELIGEPNPWITAAIAALYAPVRWSAFTVLTLGALKLSRRLPLPASTLRTAWAAVLGVTLLLYTSLRAPSLAVVPTDALEGAWALQWRERLPFGATVAYLERGEQRYATLPLYASLPSSPQLRRLELDGGPEGRKLPKGALYYRSSLCSSAELQRACEEIERSATLDPVELNDFPAIASMVWLPYNVARVKVGLYRVR